jgi:hypothetical protein
MSRLVLTFFFFRLQAESAEWRISGRYALQGELLLLLLLLMLQMMLAVQLLHAHA